MDEQAPKAVDILDGVSNLDTARMTLGWALERIRHLESAQAETLEIVKQAHLTKDTALQDLEETRRSLSQRESAVAQKERFVAEMQATLNRLFKSDMDVKEFLGQKERLARLEGELEAGALERGRAAEERHRKELEEHARRLAEMEASYAASAAEARNTFRLQMEEVQRQRQEQALALEQKEARFKEDLLEQVQKQAEQYQQKLVMLQLEYSAKRSDLQKDYEGLKERLFREARQVEAQVPLALRSAQARWATERGHLEQEKKRLEEQLRQQREAFQKLEAELRKTEEALPKAAAELRRTLATRHEAELEALREEMRQSERRCDATLAEEAAKRVPFHEELFLKQRQSMESLERGFREKEARLEEEFRRRLPALTLEHDRSLEALRTQHREALEGHERELQALRARHRQDLESKESAIDQEVERRLKARHPEWERLERALETITASLRETLQNASQGQASVLDALRRQCGEISERDAGEFSRLAGKLEGQEQSLQVLAERVRQLCRQTPEEGSPASWLPSKPRGWWALALGAAALLAAGRLL